MVVAEHAEQETALARRGSRGGRVRLGGGEGVQQIGAADDADHAALLHHRHPLDVMLRQQPGDLGQLGVLGDGDDRRRHHVAGGAVRRAQLGEEAAIGRGCRRPPA